MISGWSVVVLLVLLLAQLAAKATTTSRPDDNNNNINSKATRIYTNQFVIQVEGGEKEARKLAAKHGFVYLNHILDDFYHLEHRRLARRSTEREALNVSIQNEPQVSYGCYFHFLARQLAALS